jgi:hypothetical protein
MKLSNLYNPLMKWLLQSPLHRTVSGMYMLVHFTGRKSGKAYSTPVEYFYDGDTLMFFTAAERVWWKNLRGGAPVAVVIKGQRREGTADGSAGDPAVFGAAFEAYLQRYPGRERFFNIRREADGSLNAEDIQRNADTTAVVAITLA